MTFFILALSLINYFAGIALSFRKSFVICFIIVALDLCTLGYFKYSNFFIENLHSLNLLNSFNTLTYLVIPLGISFFTFELVHYIVDVYKGEKPIFNLFIFLNFIFFFPTLFAGPIKRFESFAPQLNKSQDRKIFFNEGLLLLIRGLTKKVIFADTLANFVAYGFANTSNSLVILIAIYAFSLQIYFDFSGYTDIARGSARLFGIIIPENFLSPYFSQNIREFWRRWHITLMSWLRDYVYIPLGGSRKGKSRGAINTLVVFLLSGLWHGAAWHYILWGFYHGSLMVIYNFARSFRKIERKINLFYKLLSVLITFQLVTFGWIFFRASSVNSAFQIITDLLNINNYHFLNLDFLIKFTVILVFLAIYVLTPYTLNFIKPNKKIYNFSKNFIYSVALLIIFLSFPTNNIPFIYFQF